MKIAYLALAASLLACAPDPLPAAAPPPAAPAPPAPPVASAAPRPDESFRDHPPAAEPAHPFVVPAVTRLRLHNGIPVVVMRQPSPFVAIRITAAGGVPDVGPDHVEVVDEMIRSLIAGTAKRSLEQLRDTFASLGMPEPETTWYVDAVSVSLLVPASKVREGIELAADLTLEPTFEQKNFERWREQLAAAVEKRDEANAVDYVMRRVLFGSHAYGAGTVSAARTRAVTRAEIASLHARVFDASRLSIVVVGGADEKEAAAALESAFGAAPRRAGPPAPAPAPRPPSGPRLVVVDKPGTTIASIATAAVGPASGAADQEPAWIALDALTDRASGRLTTRLRDRLAYVPSIAETMGWMRASGSLAWQMRAPTDRVAPALVEADRILREFVAKGPAADDLAGMKARRALAFGAWFETAASAARELSWPLTYALPDDYIARFPERIAAVSADQVKAAAARYLDADRVRTVIVGDWAALEAPLAGLGWGPVELRTFEGEVVKPARGTHGAR